VQEEVSLVCGAGIAAPYVQQSEDEASAGSLIIHGFRQSNGIGKRIQIRGPAPHMEAASEYNLRRQSKVKTISLSTQMRTRKQ
jgi:hypothetical protein